MKIAISATGRNVERNMIATFCGCDFFLIIDTKTNSMIAVENENKDIPSEVRGTAEQLVSNAGVEGVDAVVASDIGPRALEIFDQHGIKVYQGEGKIKNAIQQLVEGRLPEITKEALQRYMDLKQEK